MLGEFPEEDCKSGLLVTELWYPRKDRFNVDEQEARELFAIDCSICLEETPEKFDRMYQEMLAANRRGGPSQIHAIDECRLQRLAHEAERVPTLCGKFQ